MIFAMVGTHEQQFDRMVRAVDELNTDEKRIIQYGYSEYVPVNAEGYKFLDFDDVKNYMLEASAVITHGGTGSVMLALSLGKIPIVAPRYKQHGEHVDNHQIQLIQALVDDGLIIPFYDGDSMQERIQEAESMTSGARKIEPDERLVSALRDYILQN